MVTLPNITSIAVTLAACTFASPALADPCEGPLPRPGSPFAGTVRYVGDGDSLCVGDSADPKSWVEVRVADYYAAELHAPLGKEAKAALERIALGKQVQCTAGKRSYDRIVAVCTLGGPSLGALMRATGLPEGGRGQPGGRLR